MWAVAGGTPIAFGKATCPRYPLGAASVGTLLRFLFLSCFCLFSSAASGSFFSVCSARVCLAVLGSGKTTAGCGRAAAGRVAWRRPLLPPSGSPPPPYLIRVAATGHTQQHAAAIYGAFSATPVLPWAACCVRRVCVPCVHTSARRCTGAWVWFARKVACHADRCGLPLGRGAVPAFILRRVAPGFLITSFWRRGGAMSTPRVRLAVSLSLSVDGESAGAFGA